MSGEKNSNVNVEVEKRLEDLFGEGLQEHLESDAPQPSISAVAAAEKAARPSDQRASMGSTPLRELKSIVLSLDWEITDGIMAGFIDQIERLKEAYEADRISLLLLRLLEAIGRYIKVKQGKAHPDAIKVLNSEYESFERIATSKEMTEKERKDILLAEVKRFKELKERITSVKSERKRSREPLKGREPGSQRGETFPRPCKHCLEAVDELKRFIRAEIAALRAELKLSQKTQEERR